MSVQINLDYYKIFFYAAKYKNITRAAQELFLTQPAATRTLHNLEAQLGCQLFLRSVRGVTLTTEGEVLYQELIPAFESIERAQLKLEQLREMETGLVRIGINNLASEYILFPIIEHFNALFPKVIVTTNRIAANGILPALDSGWIDLAVIMDFGYQPEIEHSLFQDHYSGNSIQQIPLGTYPDIFLVGPKYSDLADRPVDISTLRELPFIVPIKLTPPTRYYLNLLRDDGKPASTDLPVNGAEARLSLVKFNHGLSYFPQKFVQKDLDAGLLFKISTDEKMVEYHVFALTNTKQPLSIAAQKFIDLLTTI